MHRNSTPRPPRSHAGFTLIELLVVISILLLVSLTTIFLITSTLDSDRGRSGARILQSMIAGAKDRALHDRELRGIRLIKDEEGGNTASRFMYVGMTTTHSAGAVQVGRPDTENNWLGNGIADDDKAIVLRGVNTGWKKLYDRGLLTTGSRIKLPDDATGSWYTVDTSLLEPPFYRPNRPEMLLLSTPYLNPANIAYWNGMGTPSGGGDGPGWGGVDDNNDGQDDDQMELYWPGTNDVTDIHAFPLWTQKSAGGPGYSLELEPAVRPNQEPTVLPRNIHVDLAASFIPSAIDKPGHVDLMFSPRGNVHGPASATGFVHFVLRDTEDIEAGRTLIEAQREQYLVTVMTKTGAVASYRPNLTDSNGNGVPDDPFFYAETGRVAGQ